MRSVVGPKQKKSSHAVAGDDEEWEEGTEKAASDEGRLGQHYESSEGSTEAKEEWPTRFDASGGEGDKKERGRWQRR